MILLVLRKLVTDDWVHVSPGLVFGGWGRMEGVVTANACMFLRRLYLGNSNVEKWGDHRRKKVFINSSVEEVFINSSI